MFFSVNILCQSEELLVNFCNWFFKSSLGFKSINALANKREELSNSCFSAKLELECDWLNMAEEKWWKCRRSKTNKGQKRESVKTSLLWLYSQVSATGFANVKVGEGQTSHWLTISTFILTYKARFHWLAKHTSILVIFTAYHWQDNSIVQL